MLSFHIVGGGKYWFLLCHTPTRILTYSNGIIKYKNKINTVNNCYKKNIVFCFVFLKERDDGSRRPCGRKPPVREEGGKE